MSATHVALLRGINIGRAKRIAMADLRALLGDLGYRDVRTVLASGNAVLTAAGETSDEIGGRIGAALAEGLGVSARVTVLTVAEFAAVVAGNPLLGLADNPSRLIVGFLAGAAERPLVAPLAEREWGPEAVAVGERVVYMWCPEGYLASPLVEAVNKALGAAVTSRTWTTATRIAALAGV